MSSLRGPTALSTSLSPRKEPVREYYVSGGENEPPHPQQQQPQPGMMTNELSSLHAVLAEIKRDLGGTAALLSPPKARSGSIAHLSVSPVDVAAHRVFRKLGMMPSPDSPEHPQASPPFENAASPPKYHASHVVGHSQDAGRAGGRGRRPMEREREREEGGGAYDHRRFLSPPDQPHLTRTAWHQEGKRDSESMEKDRGSDRYEYGRQHSVVSLSPTKQRITRGVDRGEQDRGGGRGVVQRTPERGTRKSPVGTPVRKRGSLSPEKAPRGRSMAGATRSPKSPSSSFRSGGEGTVKGLHEKHARGAREEMGQHVVAKAGSGARYHAENRGGGRERGGGRGRENSEEYVETVSDGWDEGGGGRRKGESEEGVADWAQASSVFRSIGGDPSQSDPTKPVGLELVLEEEFNVLVATDKRRERFVRMVEDELCESLALSTGRVAVLDLASGSMSSVVVNLNILPDANGNGATPALLAHEVTRQCKDPNSKIRRAFSTRHARSAKVCAAFPMEDQVASAHAPSDSTKFSKRSESKGSVPVSVAVTEEPLTPHGDKVAMFKQLEKSSGRVPHPGHASVSSPTPQPHFTAPMSARKARAAKEGPVISQTRGETAPAPAPSDGEPSEGRWGALDESASIVGAGGYVDEESLPNITSATDLTLGTLNATNATNLLSPASSSPLPSSTPLGATAASGENGSSSKFGVRLRSIPRSPRGGGRQVADLLTEAAEKEEEIARRADSSASPPPHPSGQGEGVQEGLGTGSPPLATPPVMGDFERAASQLLSASSPPPQQHSQSPTNKHSPPTPSPLDGAYSPVMDDFDPAAWGLTSAPATPAVTDNNMASSDEPIRPSTGVLSPFSYPIESSSSSPPVAALPIDSLQPLEVDGSHAAVLPAADDLAAAATSATSPSNRADASDAALEPAPPSQGVSPAASFRRSSLLPALDEDVELTIPLGSELEGAGVGIGIARVDAGVDEGSRVEAEAPADEGRNVEMEHDVATWASQGVATVLSAEEMTSIWRPREVVSLSVKEHAGVVFRNRGNSLPESILNRSEPAGDKAWNGGWLQTLFFTWGWGLVKSAEQEGFRDGELGLHVPSCKPSEEWQAIFNANLSRFRSPKSNALDADAVQSALRATVDSVTHDLNIFLLLVWMVVSQLCTVVCVRELIVWTEDCPAFALPSEIESCILGRASSFIPFVNNGTMSPNVTWTTVGVGDRQEQYSRDLWEGGVLSAAIFVCLVCQSAAMHHYLHERAVGVMGATSGLISVLYSKALNSMAFGSDELSDEDGHSAQNLSSLIIEDVNSVVAGYLVGYLPHATAISCLASALLCVREVGVAGLTALPVLFLLGAVCWAASTTKWQAVGQMTLSRLQVLHELLCHFESVRLLNIADVFVRRLTDLRKAELNELSNPLILRAVIGSIVLASPAIVNALVVSIHRLGGGGLAGLGTGLSVFSTLMLLSSIQLPLALISLRSSLQDKAHGAIGRILSMLQSEDRGRGSQVPVWQASEPPIIMQGCAFFWTPKPPRGAYWLGKDDSLINAVVQRGTLVGVVANRSEGCSSVLEAIAGVMPLVQGKLEVRGEIAHVRQNPSLIVGTVRQNVTYGLGFDRAMYVRALECSGLADLVEKLPNGDVTVVGCGKEATALQAKERYMVALARAVYSDADIFLIDGMFQHLGEETGRKVWNSLVIGQLKAKTVVVAGPVPQDCLMQCNSLILLSAERGQNGLRSTVHYATPPALAAEGRAVIGLVEQPSVVRPVDAVATVCPTKWISPIHTSAEQRALLALSPPPPWGLAQYLSNAGILPVAAACLLAAISQAILSAAFYWLLALASPTSLASTASSPLQVPDLSAGLGDDIKIGVLWGLVVGGLLFATVSGIFWVKAAAIPGSSRLHATLISSVVRGSPLQMASSLADRLALSHGRFNHCLGAADVEVHQGLQSALHYVLAALGSVVIMTIWLCSLEERRDEQDRQMSDTVRAQGGSPAIYCLAPALALVSLCWLCYKANGAIRSMSRLGAASSAAVHSMCFATADSLRGLRGARPQFIATMRQLVDDKVRVDLAGRGLQRWLGLRVDTCTSLLAGLTAATLVILKQSGYFSSPYSSDGLVMTGFTMAMALHIFQLLQWAVLSGAPAFSLLHGSLHTLVSGTRGGCPPEEDLMSSTAQRGVETGGAARGAVDWKSVSVGRGCDTVINDFSCSLTGGSRVLVLGGANSGKTSLALTLVRGLSPRPGGRVSIGGIDVSQMPLEALRRLVAIVPSDPVIFSGSTIFNVDPMGRTPATDVLAELKAVGLCPVELHQIPNDFLDPNMDMSRFGHGTRQRVAIVRAILRRPSVLIFDELMRTLDEESHSLVNARVAQLPHTTILHLSRSPRRAGACSHVIVMEGGELVEFGESKQLLAQHQPSRFLSIVECLPHVHATTVKEEVRAATFELPPAIEDEQQQQQGPAMNMMGEALHYPVQSGVTVATTAAMPARQVLHPLIDQAHVAQLSSLPQEYLFALIRGVISVLHASLKVDEKGVHANLQMYRDSILNTAPDAADLSRVVNKVCGTRVINEVGELTEQMSTLTVLALTCLAALPKPVAAKDFVARITSPEVEKFSGLEKAQAIGNIIQLSIEEYGDYLELFVQVVWLLWNFTTVSTYTDTVLANLMGPLIMHELQPQEAALGAFKVLIARYDRIFEGQVTYDEPGQQNATVEHSNPQQQQSSPQHQQQQDLRMPVPQILHEKIVSGVLASLVEALRGPHDVNERNQDSFTALMVAATMGRLDMVDALLSAGADPTLSEEQGLTAVHLAALGRQPGMDYTAVLDALLSRAAGSDLASRKTAFEDAPLHLCASMSEDDSFLDQAIAMTGVLLRHGADSSTQNADGKSPIDIASAYNRPQLVSILEQSLGNSPARGGGGGGTVKGGDADGSLNSLSRLPSHSRAGECVPGSLQEGYLHFLNKKKKDWEKHFYAIVPLLQDVHGSGHGDFSYFLKSFSSSAGTAGDSGLLESINLMGAHVRVVTGTVFSIKTNSEVSKSRVLKISADSVNEMRAWLACFETVPDVSVSWVDSQGVELSKNADLEGETLTS